MDVQIKYHHTPEKKELNDHIEHRLSLALDRFERRIQRIVMHIYDMNGPRGGVDKRCMALVQLKPGGSVAFELRDTDMFCVVDRVADRLKERLRRELDRRRWTRMTLEDRQAFFENTLIGRKS